MKRLFTENFEPLPVMRKLFWLGVLLYSLFIILLCFLPQSSYPDPKMAETPGIIHIGRLVFLPIPFNSFVHWQEIKGINDFVWIILQNISNIFLLYPLVFFLLFLFEKWRSVKASLLLGFSLSLIIEMSQLLLDLFFDFNRVVETDDLITNTLGAYLAYLTYLGLRFHFLKKLR